MKNPDSPNANRDNDSYVIFPTLQILSHISHNQSPPNVYFHSISEKTFQIIFYIKKKILLLSSVIDYEILSSDFIWGTSSYKALLIA